MPSHPPDGYWLVGGNRVVIHHPAPEGERGTVLGEDGVEILGPPPPELRA